MTRLSTGLCFAAAVGFAATLGAQSPTSTTTASHPTTDKDHEVTVTGCLSKAAAGYELTNARMEPNAAASTTTAAGSTTTATGTSGTNPDHAASMTASTWMLTGDSDLEKHVGHKIQVTGKTSWDGSMDHGRTAATTASGAGTTAAPPSAATTTSGSNAEPRLDVKSIKMVSTSCS
jgi:hypothetical protein